jgi:preprotein translocase subunit SecA
MIDKFLGLFVKVFGSRNERELKRMQPIIDAINAREPEFERLTDAEIRGWTDRLKSRLADGETLDDILVDAFALVREVSKRTPPPGGTTGLRHFDVQLIGGIVLHRGMIAEMATGEGKTLVATCPAYLNALGGGGVHVITVNDYLARRDREWMGPIYEKLGLTVGVIQSEMKNAARREAYAADVTYGTNNEFGFDYLRDNMKSALEDQVQRRGYAILDEVDNILIDEARTPLIISGPSEGDTDKYGRADQFARKLKKEVHFEIKEKESQAILSEEGILEAQRLVGVDSFYGGKNMEWPHLLEQSLRAHHLFKRDVDYVVDVGESGQREVIIVDEFTGRLMSGRRWSDGLHQAIEAKERIGIRAENQTLATITFQNFFKLYKKLSGMTGTALTEAGEFLSIYKLGVMAIPTNVPMIRDDREDMIYASEQDKFYAIIDDIRERYEEGRPVLVGTTSIEKSERLSEALKRRGIEHEVLNAKQHAREAEIVAKAGERGRVTIATNMAGRGTDIKLTREVRTAGGLHVLGTERHEARRIDNQLRGRSGRQGDPGSSRFYLCLEDDLMRRFAGPKVSGMLQKLGLKDNQAIEHRWVSRSVERAQKKVEERNFEIRKRLLEYDEVMNEQRTMVYDHRQRILRGEDLREMMMRMVSGAVDRIVDTYCPKELEPSQWEMAEVGDWYKRKTGLDCPTLPPAGEDPTPVLIGALEALYDERAAEFGPELTDSVARFILLNAFDTRWKEHLYNMDALKSGIGLRAYANEDPKIAYKREGYLLFEEMLRAIEEEVCDLVFRIEIKGRDEEALKEKDVWGGAVAHHEDFASGRDDMEAAAFQSQSQEAPKPFRREEPKVGRNDPCPCGSGKKYKKCHGVV